MRQALGISVAILIVAFVATQLGLPPILEGRAEDELTAGGGSADVSLEATPALRLLFSDGDRIAIEASGVSLELGGDESLDRLDGFDEVDVELNDVRAAPFDVQGLSLTRAEGAENYRLDVTARASGSELARFAGEELAGALGGFLGGLAGGLALSDRAVPVRIDAEIASVNGRPSTVSSDARVAGLPAGPFAELFVQAVVARL